MTGVSWYGAIRLTSLALMFVALTYASYYGARLVSPMLQDQRLPTAILFGLTVVLGGVLAAASIASCRADAPTVRALTVVVGGSMSSTSSTVCMPMRMSGA